jgi:hypothetical protein
MRHPAVRLDDSAVSEIRRRCAAGIVGTEPKITHEELAARYGVNHSHVTNISNWRARAA